MDLSSPGGVQLQILHLHSRNKLAERQACGLWPGQHLSLTFCSSVSEKQSHAFCQQAVHSHPAAAVRLISF